MSGRLKAPLAVACMLVVAFALFESAKWATLADASGVGMGAVYVSRFTGIATYAAVAMLFCKHPPKAQHLFAIVIPSLLLYLLVSILGSSFHDEALQVGVFYATGVFYGIACSLLMLFCICSFAMFTPRISIMLFAVSHVITDCFMAVFGMVDMDVLLIVRNLFILLGAGMYVCVAYILYRDCGKVAESCRNAWSSPCWAMCAGGSKGNACFPACRIDWMALIAAVVVYQNLFGVIAQVSSGTGDSFALYDMATNVIVIVLGLLLVVFLWFRGAHLGFITVVGLVTTLYATGFAFYSYAWMVGSPLAGALIRAGHSFGSILTWALVARKAYRDQDRSYFYLGALMSFSSVYPGRAVGSLIMGAYTGPKIALLHGLSLGALWIICIFAIVAFLLAFRKSSGLWSVRHRDVLLSEGDAYGARGDVGDEATSKGMSSSTSLGVMGEPDVDTFALQVKMLASCLQLSQREEEVMVEMLHGRSRADIAKKLCLSPETIKTYINRVYSKAGVSSKRELISLVEKAPLP